MAPPVTRIIPLVLRDCYVNLKADLSDDTIDHLKHRVTRNEFSVITSKGSQIQRNSKFLDILERK